MGIPCPFGKMGKLLSEAWAIWEANGGSEKDGYLPVVTHSVALAHRITHLAPLYPWCGPRTFFNLFSALWEFPSSFDVLFYE